MSIEKKFHFTRETTKHEIPEIENETDEFVLGVVDGFHYHGKVWDHFPDIHTKTPEKLRAEDFRNALIFAAASRRLEDKWNNEQCLDFIKGFVAGVEVRIHLKK